MQYTDKLAEAYRSVLLDGSSFEIALAPAVEALGDLSHGIALDFGAGTGRSAVALKNSGAEHVVAVDNDPAMLHAAERQLGIGYVQIGETLPFRDGSINAALAANVFSEFDTLSRITKSCHNIFRVLRDGCRFSIVATNPDSLSHDYVSFRYINMPRVIKSGTPITCLLKAQTEVLIHDFFWTVNDYVLAVQDAGFHIVDLSLPLAKTGTGPWLDEPIVAPDVVIVAEKPK